MVVDSATTVALPIPSVNVAAKLFTTKATLKKPPVAVVAVLPATPKIATWELDSPLKKCKRRQCDPTQQNRVVTEVRQSSIVQFARPDNTKRLSQALRLGINYPGGHFNLRPAKT